MPAIHLNGTADQGANSHPQTQKKEGGEEPKGGPKTVLIVVMGVSGTGKSTLGSTLAKELRMEWIEGDDLHPKANVDKMSAGIPLNDADREPWLELIRTTAEQKIVELQSQSAKQEFEGGGKVQGVVVGCSALKVYYRDILRGLRRPASHPSNAQKLKEANGVDIPSDLLKPPLPEILPTFFVFINGPREVLYDRMEKRPGHFMKASMLDSQLNTLEPPTGEEGVITVSLESTTEEQVEVAKQALAEMLGMEL
ncbi:gluconokinase [Coprinopsis cinerea okayama7|uniref:gluconokinase n=1 Tax=Coprinopsis cinerea (strain Okayama-7 / 130 / ATCC MYA-4618 / FGSC 9003) TaxID=240176 RepID=A8N7L7_COPC7|nr:gluconokinase [Coprinopsis cinerea okayama7\|eukprot:XP_001830823.1 gluconokinase [Coprinopsis cinerea okayama7\